ncbi:hypothetical protein [Thermostichus vulcanus]|uniref:Uncharacterized protein n=1 Tax=Thermostichus vulcanus str. 'Rupite' TaxID=2813851 RepID=A0ABT0CDX1_THEVL|nr:hypothetical protein [Thermostichus vulcanus]MCJ2543984.1 hypothetical protein [Thermostichus vulcanus str. 'Rupite']
MATYIAYGLRIKSNIPFPELVVSEPSDTGDLEPDVCIEFGEIDWEKVKEAEVNCSQSICGILKDGIPLGDFWVSGGNLIQVQPLPGIELEFIRPIIMGPLISALLRQRGFLVLHASSVLLGESAFVFMGHSGAGKSTLATALNQKGYPLITDDVTAIRWDPLEETWQVLAGYPNVRLLPDSAEYLGYTFDKLSLIHPLALKRNKALQEGFDQRCVPVGKIYSLDNTFASKTWIEILNHQSAVIDLIRFTRVSHLLRDPENLRTHLEQCTRLAKQVKIARLHRHRSLEYIPNLISDLEVEAGLSTTQKATISNLGEHQINLSVMSV